FAIGKSIPPSAGRIGSNLRFEAVRLAPGKSRRIFSKNCKPASQLAESRTFYPSTLNSYRKPSRSK
ncbi:MAG: hypothetical protein IKR85_03040, partial [Clostridia bacterium]|nr:hypothetical protein [Clostridia bacterium]